jgi:hypothetical protein
MAWFWGFLIFFVVLMAGSFWFGYVAAERMVGREAARRTLRYTMPWLLFGFALAFVIPLLGKYGWVSFYILYAAGISAWLISWFFRKQEAGSLLADIGRNSQNKFIFWIGLIEVAVAVLQTWLFFTLVSNGVPEYTSPELEISKLVFWWSFASFYIAIGLNKLEFRENGTCFMYSFIKWQRISSYTWEPTKPNVLTIRFKPLFPLLPGFMSIAIPTKHKNVVDRILDERLPGKNL